MPAEHEADSGLPKADPKPKVKVTIPPGSGLHEKLMRALSAAGVEAESVGRGQDVDEAIAGAMEDGDTDVVVVRRSQVPGSTRRFLEKYFSEDPHPSVIVVDDTHRGDPADRASLLAAGASEVLDTDVFSDADDVAAVLECLAELETTGGRDGPEIRGNHAQPRLADFLSRSESMKRLVELARRLADAEASLLITGETGVGKERLARALHAESSRAGGPFITVNCGALPDQLLESQLFGHEKGAFTGAQSAHRGFFEQADGGALFLDEIAEMPTHLQVKLLNALQRHEVQRLGGEKTIDVDVRVIAASNRDLRTEVQEKRFREDLLYRLNVVSLEIPPLRERREDIADLIGHLIQYFRRELPETPVHGVSSAAMRVLESYSWPGNVRELINVVERAMLLGRGPKVEPGDLPDEVFEDTSVSPTHAPEEADDEPAGESRPVAGLLPPDWSERSLKDIRDAAVAEVERAYLVAALERTRGRINAAAELAGLSTRSLYDKMRRLGLHKEDYRD